MLAGSIDTTPGSTRIDSSLELGTRTRKARLPPVRSRNCVIRQLLELLLEVIPIERFIIHDEDFGVRHDLNPDIPLAS